MRSKAQLPELVKPMVWKKKMENPTQLHFGLLCSINSRCPVHLANAKIYKMIQKFNKGIIGVIKVMRLFVARLFVVYNLTCYKLCAWTE